MKPHILIKSFTAYNFDNEKIISKKVRIICAGNNELEKYRNQLKNEYSAKVVYFNKFEI